jgi:ATP synthase subunit 6
VLSLFPYVTAITGYLATTLSLSLVYMSWVSTIFFFRYPAEFTILFLPAGAPLFITPLLVLIELFSYLMRPLSLALRLFANITAGHMLLGILSFFLFKGLSANPLIVVPLLIVHCIGILEVGVAFLQIYV